MARLSWESCLTEVRNLVPRAPGMWGKAGGQQKHDWGLIRTLLIISCLGCSECCGWSTLVVHQPCPVFSAFWCVNIWGPADSELSNIPETVNHSPSESIFEMHWPIWSPQPYHLLYGPLPLWTTVLQALTTPGPGSRWTTKDSRYSQSPLKLLKVANSQPTYPPHPYLPMKTTGKTLETVVSHLPLPLDWPSAWTTMWSPQWWKPRATLANPLVTAWALCQEPAGLGWVVWLSGVTDTPPYPAHPEGDVSSAPSVFRTDHGLKHGHSLFVWCHPMMPSFCTLPFRPVLYWAKWIEEWMRMPSQPHGWNLRILCWVK